MTDKSAKADGAAARPSEQRTVHGATRDGRTHRLRVSPADVARHVLLVSENAQAEQAARRLAAIRYAGDQGESRVYTGSLGNLPVSVVCIGSGAHAAEMAVVELCALVTRPMIARVGFCTAVSAELALGDLVLSQAALRLEGASLGYVEAGYPAFAHAEAQIATVRAAEERRARFHLGVTATSAGVFGAQGLGAAGLEPFDPDFLDRLRRQRVLSIDTEASCLFTLAGLSSLRTAVVHAVQRDATGAELDQDQFTQAEELVLDVGLTTLRHMARMERERGDLRHWHDGIREDVTFGGGLRPRR